ncbi:MAG: DUF1294 domain-containing protein [Clostridia bacterium]|nr:DUF1294 domain-containing protein [Clostridia bacterium]
MYYYILAISVFAVVLCVYDKSAAKARMYRVRETFLYFVAFMGGAFAMYITMLLVRHKTKRFGFMVSLPLMALAHVVMFVIYGKEYGYWI